MTDNRTTELRAKLTERDVEFAADDLDHLLTTSWQINDVFVQYLESIGDYVDEDDPTMRFWMNNVTPEQAIAATLGWIEEPDTIRNELTDSGLIDTRAELGSGTLTAEQVREAVMSADRWEKPMGNTGLTNTHLIIRDDGWQAIADELNAALVMGAVEP